MDWEEVPSVESLTECDIFITLISKLVFNQSETDFSNSITVVLENVCTEYIKLVLVNGLFLKVCSSKYWRFVNVS